MGTKENPGAFDCYANAEPDEPMFVLLARDHRAPTLVRAWAETHRAERIAAWDGSAESYPYGVTDKEAEALTCANAMEVWRDNHR
jgi:hypothetical protein